MRSSVETRRTVSAVLLFALLLIVAISAGGQAQRAIRISEEVHTERPFELLLVSAIRDFVPNVMRAKGTPGLNLALGYKGRLIWEAGFGWADVAKRKPMTPDTVYHSGSLGKTYTATAVMHLVDRGVLALDDPINEHLPFEVHNPLGERAITIRDLLTHRSGLSTGGARGLWHKPESLEQALQASYDSDKSPVGGGVAPFWVAKVGARYNYANPGIATLGLIVETANPDGLSFADYVQKHIMDPLGMELSQYPPAQHEDYVRPEIWEHMSTGYARMGGALIPTVPLYFSHYPAGGVLAKPADHLRLLMAMMNDGEYKDYRVLEADTVEEMLTPQFEELAPGMDLGLVWLLRDHGEPNMSFSHAGGHMFGWRTDGYGWPELDLSLMVASNQWSLPDDAQDIAMIPTFVEEWMTSAAPDVDLRAAPAEWAWKVSYVRGVLYAAMFRMYVGVSGEMPKEALDAAIASTRVQEGARDDWNADAFRQGIEDIRGVGFGYADVTGFWSSEACRVSLNDVRVILAELGARFPRCQRCLVSTRSVGGARLEPWLDSSCGFGHSLVATPHLNCAEERPMLRARPPFIVLALSLFLVVAAASAVDFEDTRLLHQPAVSDRHVAFAYAGDLWLADRDGRGVRRLTSHEGDETSPRFSPDGDWIAFSAEYDGNTDVYVMPIAGGSPRRLTWHPSADLVQGFSPDGREVMFASSRQVFTFNHTQLFTVPVEGGGLPERLPIPHGLRASYSTDGKKIAYIPIQERFFQWKNYRGGTTSRIWVVRSRTSYEQVEQVPQPEGRSQRHRSELDRRHGLVPVGPCNGEFNLFSFEPGTGWSAPAAPFEQKTDFDEFPVERVVGERRDADLRTGRLPSSPRSRTGRTESACGSVWSTISTRPGPAGSTAPSWIRSADAVA